MAFLLIQLIILAILHKRSITKGEGDVKVKDNAPCWNGKSHTLTCELKNKTPDKAVEWMNGNDAIPIIHCDNNTCLLNPIYEGKYTKSCDLKKNIYNLTILAVENYYDKKKFVCSDGTNSDCTILNVEEEKQSLEETEDGKITATSACSSLDKEVLFQWIKIDPKSKNEEEFRPNVTTNNITCSKECSSNSKRYTEVISASSGGNGTKYLLKMKIYYGTELVESKPTHDAYMIEDLAEIETKRDNMQKIEHNDHDIVAVAVVVPVVVVPVVIAVIIVVIAAVAIWRKRSQKAEKTKNLIVRSESGEKKPLNSVDTGAVTHQEKESEAKIAVKGEVIIKHVDGDNNQGSDHDTQVDTGAVTHQEKESEAKIAVKGEVIIKLVDGDNNQGSDHDTPISALEKRARDESFLHTDTLLIM